MFAHWPIFSFVNVFAIIRKTIAVFAKIDNRRAWPFFPFKTAFYKKVLVTLPHAIANNFNIIAAKNILLQNFYRMIKKLCLEILFLRMFDQYNSRNNQKHCYKNASECPSCQSRFAAATWCVFANQFRKIAI